MGIIMTKTFTSIDVIRRDNTRRLQSDMNLSRREFSELVEVSYGLLGHYIGKNPIKSIGDDVARRIEKNTGKPEYWLDHDHTIKPSSISDLKARMDVIESSSTDTRPSAPNDTQYADNTFDKDYQCPVISWVAAGSFSDVIPVTIDDVIDWIPKPRNLSDKAFGLVIEGRSMMPEFKPNEIIYVEPQVDVWSLKDGDLVVIQCNDDKQATFKQLVIGESHDDMYLKPLNPDWHEQKITPMSECKLVGIVKGKYTIY